MSPWKLPGFLSRSKPSQSESSESEPSPALDRAGLDEEIERIWVKYRGLERKTDCKKAVKPIQKAIRVAKDLQPEASAELAKLNGMLEECQLATDKEAWKANAKAMPAKVLNKAWLVREVERIRLEYNFFGGKRDLQKALKAVQEAIGVAEGLQPEASTELARLRGMLEICQSPKDKGVWKANVKAMPAKDSTASKA